MIAPVTPALMTAHMTIKTGSFLSRHVRSDHITPRDRAPRRPSDDQAGEIDVCRHSSQRRYRTGSVSERPMTRAPLRPHLGHTSPPTDGSSARGRLGCRTRVSLGSAFTSRLLRRAADRRARVGTKRGDHTSNVLAASQLSSAVDLKPGSIAIAFRHSPSAVSGAQASESGAVEPFTGGEAVWMGAPTQWLRFGPVGARPRGGHDANAGKLILSDVQYIGSRVQASDNHRAFGVYCRCSLS
jgi:hypothetical protein